MLLEIIEALDVAPSEFFADDYTTYKNDKEIIDLLKMMSKEKREHLLSFIKK